MRADFQHLLDRMARRLYPETLQALAFYWVKTARANGYECSEWKALYRLLEHAIQTLDTNPDFVETLTSLHAYVHDEGFLTDKPRPPATPEPGPDTWPGLDRETLAPYFSRLLNEWVPKELARMLLDDAGANQPDDPDVRSLTFGRAVERLLLRTRLSIRSCEMLLEPNVLTPRFVYAADYEVVRDVLLFLLRRTDAPAFPLLPGELLGAAPDEEFQSEYEQDVRSAAAISVGEQGEELRVPISPGHMKRLVEAQQFRITSLVVTMDGRWWQADKLDGGGQDAIIYRPMGRLRIDFSWNEARIQVPWAESRLNWSGAISFSSPIHLFGREWAVAAWEQAAEHTWLDLKCLGPLSAGAMSPRARASLQRYRPANVEMGWTALEAALADSVSRNNGEPIEKLRRDELIPLGRALYSLTEALTNRRLRTQDAIRSRLAALTYRAAEVRETYGLIPWRILPKPVREYLPERESTLNLPKPLTEVFADMPEISTHAASPFGLIARLWNK